MAFSSATQRVLYTATGSASVYAYTFKIQAQTDLLVVVRATNGTETTLTLTTDYTVSGVGTSGGGNVTLVDSNQAWLDSDGDLIVDYKILIMRVRPLTQTIDIRNQGSYFPETHENAFDQHVMIGQQLQEQLNRTVMLKKTSSISGLTLPDPEAGSYLRWNEDEDGLENTTLTSSGSAPTWAEIMVNGNTTGSDILFSANNAWDIGKTGARAKDLWVAGTATLAGGGTLGGVFAGAHSYSGIVSVTNATASTNASTGCVVLSGGLGIAGNTFSSGNHTGNHVLFNANNTYDIGSTGTRARDGWFAGTLTAAGGGTLSGTFAGTPILSGATVTFSGATASTTTTTGTVVVTGGVGVSGQVTVGGAVKTTDSTASTSTTTGSGIFAGGVGVAGKIYCAGLNATGVTTSTVTTTSANYTVLGTSDTIGCNTSGGNVEVELLASATNIGKIVTVKKVHASNKVIIDANSSEDIDGSTTSLELYGVNEAMTLQVNAEGTGWDILSRYDGGWTAFTPSWTNLTLNTTGYTAPVGYWRRDGADMILKTWLKNGSGGAASGAGNLTLTIPLGLALNTAVADNSSIVAAHMASNVFYNDSTPAFENQIVAVSSSTTLGIYTPAGVAIANTSLDASDGIKFEVRLPISGWV